MEVKYSVFVVYFAVETGKYGKKTGGLCLRHFIHNLLNVEAVIVARASNSREAGVLHVLMLLLPTQLIGSSCVWPSLLFPLMFRCARGLDTY